MTTKNLVNQTTVRILYFKYKAYIIPAGIIFVCIILFFAVIIPQIQDYFALQDTKAQLQNRVTVLTKNYSFLNTLDASLLDKDVRIVTKALPQDKDFTGVLDAISNAAVTAGVRLGDYSFNVGDLTVGKDTSLQITLGINGGLTDVSHFVTALKKQLPLADVLEVQSSGLTSSVSLVFFYKPFPKVNFQPDTEISFFSTSDKKLLQTLEQMSLSSAAGPVPVATGGAQ